MNLWPVHRTLSVNSFSIFIVNLCGILFFIVSLSLMMAPHNTQISNWKCFINAFTWHLSVSVSPLLPIDIHQYLDEFQLRSIISCNTFTNKKCYYYYNTMKIKAVNWSREKKKSESPRFSNLHIPNWIFFFWKILLKTS